MENIKTHIIGLGTLLLLVIILGLVSLLEFIFLLVKKGSKVLFYFIFIVGLIHMIIYFNFDEITSKIYIDALENIKIYMESQKN